MRARFGWFLLACGLALGVWADARAYDFQALGIPMLSDEGPVFGYDVNVVNHPTSNEGPNACGLWDSCQVGCSAQECPNSEPAWGDIDFLGAMLGNPAVCICYCGSPIAVGEDPPNLTRLHPTRAFDSLCYSTLDEILVPIFGVEPLSGTISACPIGTEERPWWQQLGMLAVIPPESSLYCRSKTKAEQDDWGGLYGDDVGCGGAAACTQYAISACNWLPGPTQAGWHYFGHAYTAASQTCSVTCERCEWDLFPFPELICEYADIAETCQ